MVIKSYLEQLRRAAAPLPGDTERHVRLAFLAAGLPSSTYYRARNGAQLRFDTASQVAGVLHRWKNRGSNDDPTGSTAPSVEAA